jgi:hypothetical protein
MLEVEQSVRVLSPFAESFPGHYVITEVIVHEDGQIAYVLGDLGGFAPIYVEAVE